MASMMDRKQALLALTLKEHVLNYHKRELHRELSPDEKARESWSQVVYHFLRAPDGFIHPDYNIEVIISRFMSEMDPSLSHQDQVRKGWDKTGKVSFQDFQRVTALTKDLETRLSINWT
eukprot:TRINITY_DN4209_c0_g7_i1.p1 TRINITY_DN4209_c0_g7~~TRINITY_DN4209_c0_g7_i1.p1  ORF type:complete len:119 (-),score=25.68 TRINITY_DN4209_c0_g7_i1:118-474(-)